MPIIVLLFCLVLCLPADLEAAFDPAVLEGVAETYSTIQPGLESYIVNLQTDKVEEMLEQMTGAMPAGVPRPPTPRLRKYWSARSQEGLVRAEGDQVFPYMQEMAARFSQRFAIDLRRLLFPPQAAAARRRLLEGATVRSFETRLEDARTLTVEVSFPAPVDLEQAFYGEGLGLPQEGVDALAFDIDPERRLLNRLEIVSSGSSKRVVELRHEEVGEGVYRPQEVRVTTPDGRIDDRFETVFGIFEGFRLPARQTRTILRSGSRETVTVRFRGYRINVPLPPDVAARLNAL